jgi:hypothetical protein
MEELRLVRRQKRLALDSSEPGSWLPMTNVAAARTRNKKTATMLSGSLRNL